MVIWAYLATPWGRFIRVFGGGFLAAVMLSHLRQSAFWQLRGIFRLALTGFGVAELVGGIFNLCALAPIFGGHFFGRRNLEEFGR